MIMEVLRRYMTMDDLRIQHFTTECEFRPKLLNSLAISWKFYGFYISSNDGLLGKIITILKQRYLYAK